MFKNFIFYLLFVTNFFSLQSCFADEILEKIADVHMLKERNQLEINKYILKNYNIDRANPDQLKLLIQTRLTIESSVYEHWKKAYGNEFTKKERDYITMLYSSDLMERFFKFNSKFGTRKEVQEIIKSKMATKFQTATVEAKKKSSKK